MPGSWPGSRSTRPAGRMSWTTSAARSTCRPIRSCFPCPGRRCRRNDGIPCGRAGGRAGPRHRQLPQRVHLSSATWRIGGEPGVPVSIVRPEAALVRERAGAGLCAVWWAVPGPAGPPCRRCIRSSEAGTALLFLLQYWQLGWQPLLGVPLGVRGRDDRAVRDRPPASHTAQRHHAAGGRHREWLSVSCSNRGGRRRSSASRPAAGSSGWLVRSTSGSAARKAWVWATSRCSP